MTRPWARRWMAVLILAANLVGLAACGAAGGTTQTPAAGEAADVMPDLAPATLAEGETLQVVATTTIVADVVAQVAGDRVTLVTLMPLGTDPHEFEPTPQDVAAVSNAQVVFINGAGLETFIDRMLQSAGQDTAIVPVSAGVELLPFGGEPGGASSGADVHTLDPHVWFDPNNVGIWVENIKTALSALDPANVAFYEENAAAYTEQLQALDSWIREQVRTVPEERRKLVTDHATFGYFAATYGFDQVGVVIPGGSTLAQPSAQQIANLIQTVEAQQVPAIFIGASVNPQLAQQVSDDTGAQLVLLYTGSLSEPGGPAASYLAFMNYDVTAIVGALR